jgi:hypothetical protein
MTAPLTNGPRISRRITTVPRRVRVPELPANVIRLADARPTEPMLDTADDPTGAALVWPLLMLVVYALIAVGILMVF